MAACGLTDTEYRRLVLGEWKASNANPEERHSKGVLKKIEGHQIGEIRRIINEFPLIEKKRPTVPSLCIKINASEIGIKLSISQTRTLLLDLGYK